MRLRLATGGLLAAVVLATGARAEQPFSRSRWIEERMALRPFSGGVMPSGPAPEAAPPALPELLWPGLPGALYPNYRVSRDIVPGPYGSAQPETQTEPFLAINPADANNLLAGYQDCRFATGGARALTYAYSTDGGKKWREQMVPGLTIASGGVFEWASDPWVAFGPDNRAYFLSIAGHETDPLNGVYINVSTDGGKTFGDPIAVHENRYGEGFDDKESMAVDTGASSPYRGYVYVGWDDANNNIMYLSRSRDGGESWDEPVVLQRNRWSIGIVLAVGPRGTAYAVWTQAGATPYPDIVCSKSTNGGATWSTPVKIATVDPAGVPGLRTGDVPLVSLAINPKSGALSVAWQDSTLTPGTDQILYSRSTNGGATWMKPMRVSDGPADAAAFTPAVAVDAQGRVAVCYYSLRNDPSRRYLVDEYIAISSDKGKTFAASQRVSRATFDVRYAARAYGYFLGDYQSMVASSALFHPLFVATFRRSAIDSTRLQPDAFSSRVPVAARPPRHVQE